MISEKNLKEIADIFIGDIIGLYPYKRGEDIVGFFNERFGYRDTYGAGVSSRWILVRDKIVDMIDKGTINNFFDLVLSVDYIRSETGLSLVESAERAEECYQRFKEIVNRDSYDIIINADKYYFIKASEDLQQIGSGGFANVYYQRSTGYVVKRLKPQFLTDKAVRSRFKREFDITKELNSIDGVIKVYDFDIDSFSYTMDKAETTLYRYILDNEINLDEKVRIIQNILVIISQVHDLDILHRDISPTNLFLLNHTIVVADFGLGKDLSTVHSHLTKYTNEIGQFEYCAPEQFRSLKVADKRSDVYSLGKVINFIMTENPRESHHEFRSVTITATNEDKEKRYNDARAMRTAFNAIIERIRNKEKQQEIDNKIANRIFDEEIKSYLESLYKEDFAKFLVQQKTGFLDVLAKFMLLDDNAKYVIECIYDTYQDICGYTFMAYDPIANFTYRILCDEKYDEAHDTAATILSYIAFVVNRFSAQDKVKSLENKGLEPYLLEILFGYKKD